MWQNVVQYAPNFLAGGAGLSLFFTVALHWRDVCNRIDQREARKNRAWGRSEKYIAFNNIFTPVYLIVGMAFLLLVSLAILFGLGAPLIKPPLVPVSTKP